MLIKIITIIVFFAIIASLASALYFLVKSKEGEDDRKTAQALTVRIGLSVLLFIFLVIAIASGLIQPHGIGAKIQQSHAEKAAAEQK